MFSIISLFLIIFIAPETGHVVSILPSAGYLPLVLPDPGEAEEGHDSAEDGPGRHVPGVMLVVSHAASGHYEGVHQGGHLLRGGEMILSLICTSKMKTY